MVFCSGDGLVNPTSSSDSHAHPYSGLLESAPLPGVGLPSPQRMASRLMLMVSPNGGWCVTREPTYLVRFVGRDAYDRAAEQLRELTALFATRIHETVRRLGDRWLARPARGAVVSNADSLVCAAITLPSGAIDSTAAGGRGSRRSVVSRRAGCSAYLRAVQSTPFFAAPP